eukprot:gene5634-7648_t
MKSYALASTLALMVLAGSACSRSEAPAKSEAKKEVSASVETKAKAGEAAKVADRYPLKGVVVSVDTTKKVLVVTHEEIPGYMPAMTMEFLVAAGDAAVAKPGQRIRADMIPSKDGDFRLEKIWPDDKAAADAVAAGANGLRQDTFTRGKNAYREVGEAIPDFALFDQE